MKQWTCICFCVLACFNVVFSQENVVSQAQPIIDVYNTDEEIIIDGLLNEQTWIKITPVKGMYQSFPNDSLDASSDTEISMAYNDQNLYVAITCYSKSGNYATTSLRRDYDFFGNDNVTLVFDTYNDFTNALAFGMNAFGIRREGTIANAGQEPTDMDESWDNKWVGESKQYDDRWTVEMAIPFTTLRFNKGAQNWGFNLYRWDTQTNEVTTWTDMPNNRMPMDLGYLGEMHWDKPLKKTGRNISIIPYVSTSSTRDFEDLSEKSTSNKINIGGDVKIGISSGLNLDLTFNPDFSQVEVDEQVTNLERFEILFPEKRQFFLENADLFGTFGGRFVNPFFSRRIGLSIDPETGQNVQNTIIYGARLSGKLNENLRIGGLSMQTASQESKGLPGFNYFVGTLEPKLSDFSRLKIMLVNKQAIQASNFDQNLFNDYNRLFGIEYNMNSTNNTWVGDISFQKTFTPGVDSDDFAHKAQLVYNTRKFRAEWAQVFIGNGFNPEVGFAPRKDFILISPEAAINFYPKNSVVANHSLGFDSRAYWKVGKDNNPYITDFAIEELVFEPFWEITFQGFSQLKFTANYTDVTLLEDFDPTRLQNEDVFLPGGSSYQFTEFEISYSSDQNKRLWTEFMTSGGSYFNGTRFGLMGSLTYRYQPYGFISLDYAYNHVKLEEPFEAVNIWLIGPRIDLTFTKKVFLTTFIQYNNQLDNLNINARFQWRFAPVSDFFIVYTDNYDTSPMSNLGSRNRALVAKMTYWFNL